MEKSEWKNERDTLFQILRKGIETIIGYYSNTEDILLKDECRKTLVRVLKREKFKVIINNLSSFDREVMHKLNADFVHDKVDRDKDQSKYIGIDILDDFDLNQMPPQHEKATVLQLKFGKVKEKDKDVSLLEAGQDMLQADQKAQNSLAEYQMYMENGNMEYFQVYKDKVFGFISKMTFQDSFNLTADWKVRFFALEEIYIQLCGLPQIKNDQLWNMTKFVFVQLNCGLRIDFLDKEKRQKAVKFSLKDFRTGFESVILVDPQLEGASQGAKYKRPLQKIYDAATDSYKVIADYPIGRRESLNPTKIDIVLLLIAQKVASYRSGLLLEPIMRLLCLETKAVRQLAFDLLANIQQLYQAKKKTLMQMYMLALKFPNWLLRCAVLNLICLALSKDVRNESLDVPARDLILSVAVLLDDDVMRVKE